MTWPGHLWLDWRREGERTLVHDRHHGPMRVLRSLYPEGPGICHTVLVHPPGGVAEGDTLNVNGTIGAGAHALVTTPGATRFLRSNGASAMQAVELHVQTGGRLEWLPLETLVHAGAQAESRWSCTLAVGAEMIGWDVLGLGLPASGQPFDRGSVLQSIELPGLWLERGRTDGSDRRLLDSPLGWAGRRVLGTAWFAAGTTLTPTRREALLHAARNALAGVTGPPHAGVTSTDGRLVVVRTLAYNVEAAMALLCAIWLAWRVAAWGTAATTPRLWRT